MPVRQAAPALDPGPHLGYAIQWFSFATIAIVGWLVMVAKSSVTRQRAEP
jgi:cytochrome oxidase assembly protein ShyY1